ncbi:hypothetical protein R5R35_012715 [Gryllus longicercus]
MFEEKIIKKVPGNVYPSPKEKQGYIENLNSKTKVELLELLERQDKLLSNKSFIKKLPDKGNRIKTFRERVLKALAEKDQIDQTCGLLSGLSLSKSNVVDEIEWTGELTGVLNESSDISSDEDTNPLKILASHSGTGRLKKKIHRRLKEQVKLETNGDTPLISVPEEDSNEENLETSIKSSKEDTTEVKPCNDLYAKHLCEKVDKPPCKKSEPFKPHSTTKSGVHPGLFVPKHQGPHWEVTAATPPPPVHGAVKLITLEESLRIQQLQAAKLKTIQAKHASEKLALNSFVKLGSILPDLSARTEYRDTQQEYDSCHSSDAEENEGQSDEDDKRDTIVYTYTE